MLERFVFVFPETVAEHSAELYFGMSQGSSAKSTLEVTLIIRDDCGACDELLRNLEYYPMDSRMKIVTINLNETQPPPFAQVAIVPATYIGTKLWKYGSYLPELLSNRAMQELQ